MNKQQAAREAAITRSELIWIEEDDDECFRRHGRRVWQAALDSVAARQEQPAAEVDAKAVAQWVNSLKVSTASTQGGFLVYCDKCPKSFWNLDVLDIVRKHFSGDCKTKPAADTQGDACECGHMKNDHDPTAPRYCRNHGEACSCIDFKPAPTDAVGRETLIEAAKRLLLERGRKEMTMSEFAEFMADFHLKMMETEGV